MSRNIFATLREWALRLTGHNRSDADLEQELTNHIALAEEDLLRRGHAPEEAHRLARVQTGKATQAMESLRDQRRFPALSSFWLDVKLGARMLAKHWGVTLAGGAAMAVAIAAGAAVYDGLQTLSGTSVPLEEGDRLVVVQPWNPATRKEFYSSPEQFQFWREQLQSVESVSAFATSQRNLITASGQSAPAFVAQISPSGFAVARVPALIGRVLQDSDERPTAEPAAVIGFSVWQNRFRADSAVLGNRIQLGADFYTVVGVMPEGFAFPIAHDVWVPLDPNSLPGKQVNDDPVWGNGSGRGVLTVFARLAPGIAMGAAHAEVKSRGLLTPETTGPGRTLEARLVPYTIGITGNTDGWLLDLIGFGLIVLLIPPCANIAVLIYARILSRQQEFAARLALGASRTRIVSQVFVEVLLMALLAAGAGLFMARQLVAAFAQEQRLERAIAFWMKFDLAPSTIVFTCVLAMVAALFAGAIPAFMATGRWSKAGATQGALHALGARTSPQLGRAWIALVVLQVALSVAFLPTAVQVAWATVQSRLPGAGFHPEQYLTAQLVKETDPAAAPRSTASATAQDFAATRDELLRQLRADPSVRSVALSQAPPGGGGEYLQIEPLGRAFSSGRPQEYVQFNQTSQGYFDTYDLKLEAGRWLEPRDLIDGRHGIVINSAFAEHLFAGSSPLGERLRLVIPPGGSAVQPEEWEVVGVVAESFYRSSSFTAYRLMPPASARPVWTLSIRAASGAANAMPRLAGRLRQIAAQLDPSLRVVRPRTLSAIYEDRRSEDYRNGTVIIGVVLGVVFFSIAGIYTILSFTVVQRRREIGIRAALGAPPARLVAGIFRRAMLPVAIGVALGSLMALGVEFYLSAILFESLEDSLHWWLAPAAELFILFIGLLAVAGPARRAMRIDPLEALRDS